ncbi:MAG: nuclear transport factor 2 family protein [Proteobacteria bacterium]|nr:nuclear transport factor 2 family protein [Pseudomonadota bacterium]
MSQPHQLREIVTPREIAATTDLRRRLQLFCEARENEEYEAIKACLVERPQFRLGGGLDTFAWSGTRFSKKDVVLALQAMNADVEFEVFICDDVIVHEDRAAILWHAQVQHRLTGARAQVEGMDHILLKDGLIEWFVEVYDATPFRYIAMGISPEALPPAMTMD